MTSCPNPSPVPRLLSTTQAARELGIASSTLGRWARAGFVIPAGHTARGHRRWVITDLIEQIRVAGERCEREWRSGRRPKPFDGTPR